MAVPPPDPAEYCVVLTDGTELELELTRLHEGRFRIESGVEAAWLLFDDEDEDDTVGMGGELVVAELPDGRLQLLEIVGADGVVAVNCCLLSRGFVASQAFTALGAEIIAAGGNWELVFGGLFSAYVPISTTCPDAEAFRAMIAGSSQQWRSHQESMGGPPTTA